MSIQGYEKITIPAEKIDLLVQFLLGVAQGPQEAIGMLHAGIKIIDEMNADVRGEPPRTPEMLGQELTACLTLAEGSMQ